MTDKLFQTYQARKTNFEQNLAKKTKLSDLLVLFRSLVSLFALGCLVYGFSKKIPGFVLYALPLILLFLILVIKHQQIKKQISYLESIVQINENALLRLSGKWTDFPNTGDRFINPEHPYSTDLNIFGRGSLFQYLNATTSFMGEQALAKLLNTPANYAEIQPRQQAIQDLAQRLDWRQHFQATGMDNVQQTRNPAQLLAWAEGKPLLSNKKSVYLLWMLPLLTLSLLTLTAFRLVPVYVPMLTLAVQLLIVIFSEKIVRQAFNETGKAVAELERYSALLKCIELEDFQAPLLIDLKRKLYTCTQTSSHQIKVLARLADRITLRYSPFIHFFINIITFWDLSTLKKLETWQSKSGSSLRKWLNVIGDLEALASLAIPAHDHPNWVLPEVRDCPPIFEAASLGHPLISEDLRICNDVSLPAQGTTLVITGSNMSGKSTFLRTIGINLVLAYAGAPVCARSLRCSLMNIYSSMQVQDNLEQRISTFYAELKQIKLIVDAAALGQPIIFLLDEIFKGTNSKDRIFGAKTVIRKLSTLSAIGLVTTHDLELGALEQEHPQFIRNCHFTDTIHDNRICFDYRLKPGIAQTTNAIALMKMIGIEI